MEKNDVKPSVYIDVLAEPYLDMIRILLITKEFQLNRKQKKILSIEKISFFNSVIVSNRMTTAVINHYERSPFNEYENDQEESFSYIDRNHFIEALKGDIVRELVIKLSDYDYLEVEKVNENIYVTTKNDFNYLSGDPLLEKWKSNLKRLQFCMSKSNRELFNCLIGMKYE